VFIQGRHPYGCITWPACSHECVVEQHGDVLMFTFGQLRRLQPNTVPLAVAVGDSVAMGARGVAWGSVDRCSYSSRGVGFLPFVPLPAIRRAVTGRSGGQVLSGR